MAIITQAVGARNGVAMPNHEADLRTVTGLLDRIGPGNGGTAATPRQWSPVRGDLIAQVAAALVRFQRLNRRPVCDGAIAPGDANVRLMNRLALLGPVTVTSVWREQHSSSWGVADSSSMAGRAPLAVRSISPTLTRALVSTTGTSIKWFGVAFAPIPAGATLSGTPHVFFTPAPYQGGYRDGDYEQFTTWRPLWEFYTSLMGSQIVASGRPHILVIPIYRNSQLGHLGDFLTNWRDSITAVITASVRSITPSHDTFLVNEIFSSSFSNGIRQHRTFFEHAGPATRKIFDLDGHASGTGWEPPAPKGVVYRNTAAPGGRNPDGNRWHVGGRLTQLRQRYPYVTPHNLCTRLLLHGISTFG